MMKWNLGQSLEDIKREAILEALIYHNWNRVQAARALGISVRMVRMSLNKWRKAGHIVPETSIEFKGFRNTVWHLTYSLVAK